MNLPPFEPLVRVGLCEDSGFGLHPEGPYDVNASENQIVYTPLSPDSRMKVSGITIGRGFHWESKHTFRYRGSIILSRNCGKSLLVNALKAEEYLQSVISSEMSPDAPAEYLKAHAIISRSWLLQILSGAKRPETAENYEAGHIITYTQNEAHTGFDVCPDDHCQRYQGIDAINPAALRAVMDTRGNVLTFRGEIADARFSKCCGGITERFSTCWNNLDYPYLPAKEDPYCDPSALSPQLSAGLRRCLKNYDADTSYYRWEKTVPKELIRQNLRKQHNLNLGEIISLEPLSRGDSGRIHRLRIIGSKGSVIIGKELTIRRLLSDSHLYSSAFEIEKTSAGFLLRGRGWGHGVGLCQTGAAVMALRGMTCREILSFYYPGTSLTKIYD